MNLETWKLLTYIHVPGTSLPASVTETDIVVKYDFVDQAGIIKMHLRLYGIFRFRVDVSESPEFTHR